MSVNALMPSPNVLLASGNALTRYRPIFTSMQVFERPDNGRRIEINDEGHTVIFDLSAEQAKHLAGLLA